MNPELVKNAHSVGQNCFHITWTPKYRYPVAQREGMRRVIYNSIMWTARKHRIKLIELRVMPDHVHVFVHIPQNMSIAKCAQLLKGGSSYEVRKFIPRMKKYKALWSRGYFYRSVGAVTGTVVEQYIRNSKGENAYWNQPSLTDAIGLTSDSE